MSPRDTARPQIDRVQKRALAVGVLSLFLAVIFGALQSRGAGAEGWVQFLRSYVFAYMYWIAISLGCIAILMLHHLTGGWWGLPIRRILEAGSRTLGLMAVLFLPVLVGMGRLYPWMRPGEISDDPVDHFKRVYLQPGFFIVRTVVYLACFVVLAHFLSKWSAEQDRTGDVRFKDRMESLSGPGLVIWGLAITGAAIDWVMSLEPHWFSTVYGMIFMALECLAAISFAVLILRLLGEHEPLKDSYEPKRLLDLGNLMLTFTLLLTYVSFGQFLIIWAGNLKDEIPWYMSRAFGGWAYVASALLVLHFFVPFFVLLQRAAKRRLQRLSTVASWILVLTLVDVYWLVVPAYEKSGPRIHPTDIFAVIGIGGVWVAWFMAQLKKMPLLPVHDPRFEGVLEPGHGD
ncbi:MAG TPA: hypothetical protein VJO53_02355 [Candidatus Acidoferrales bacterium]|nr:hypothetical protein [Candidatus Acidoferrales bacterium]